MGPNQRLEFETEGRFSRRAKTLFVTAVVLGVLVLFGVFLVGQYEEFLSIERQIAAINREIAEEMEITQALLHQRAIRGSAEYFERAARERLGLIHRNEIVIRMRN